MMSSFEEKVFGGESRKFKEGRRLCVERNSPLTIVSAFTDDVVTMRRASNLSSEVPLVESHMCSTYRIEAC